MSNENINELKSEILSFWDLVKEKYCIEIPKIQRDYAQGRNDEKSKEVREEFLNTLKKYLDGSTKNNTLDFVYGNVSKIDGANEKLILLDGQQRLTTLFLLHWFTALCADKFYIFQDALLLPNEKSRFVYNTRESSNNFCVALLKYGEEVFAKWDEKKKQNPQIKFSQIIRNEKWFFISYTNDLTIKSMLTMIDAISQKFSDSKKYFGLLTDEKNPAITFNFLPMKENGLGDDLYIKMNSRGRELTRFENLKSKILAKLDKIKFDKTKREEFSRKIDTEWLDLFWSVRDEKNLNHFDGTLLNFFEAVFVNEFAVQNYNCDKNKTAAKVKEFIEKSGHIPFAEILCERHSEEFSRQSEEIARHSEQNFRHSELVSESFSKNQFQTYIENCAKILDAITEKSDSKSRQKTYFDSNFIYYDEKTSFKNLINHSGKYEKENAYPERILFYAYCAYLEAYENPDAHRFARWMRICANLVKNTRSFDSENDFCNALNSIKTLLEFCKNDKNDGIYNSILSFNEKLPGLDENQLQEEKVKAFLISSDSEWKKNILTFENQKYFCGQLSFALNYAGLWDILEKTEDDEKNLLKSQKQKFDECVGKTFALFDENGVCAEAKRNARLVRALLSVSNGDYMMNIGQNWSFLIDNHRDISWKNYLKDDSHKNYDGTPIRNYFYNLIDDKFFNPEDLSSLENICEEHKKNCPEWTKCFIEHPELLDDEGFSFGGTDFKIGNEKLCRTSYDGKSFYILSGKQMNSYHVELFTVGKYLELKKGNFDATPFKSLEYYSVATKDGEPCLFLNNWNYQAFDFALDCIHEENSNDEFLLTFFDRNNRKEIDEKKIKFPKEIEEILKSNGFKASDDFEYHKVVKSEVGGKELEDFLKNLLKSMECL